MAHRALGSSPCRPSILFFVSGSGELKTSVPRVEVSPRSDPRESPSMFVSLNRLTPEAQPLEATGPNLELRATRCMFGLPTSYGESIRLKTPSCSCV